MSSPVEPFFSSWFSGDTPVAKKEAAFDVRQSGETLEHSIKNLWCSKSRSETASCEQKFQLFVERLCDADKSSSNTLQIKQTLQNLWSKCIKIHTTSQHESLSDAMNEIDEKFLSAERKERLCNDARFEQSLTSWELEAAHTEDREYAAKKIRDHYYHYRHLGQEYRPGSTSDRLEWVDDSVKLDFTGLNLRSLPEAIGMLSHLQCLRAEGCGLTKVPQSIGKLNSLQQLYLGGNRHMSLPEEVANLSNLRVLKIDNNGLGNLPLVICRLPQLTHLFADRNDVKSLPKEIVNLHHLVNLSLADNKLSQLPDGLEGLSSLRYLDLADNPFSKLPDSLVKLKSLKELRLRRHLQKPPVDDSGINSEILSALKTRDIVVITEAMPEFSVKSK